MIVVSLVLGSLTVLAGQSPPPSQVLPSACARSLEWGADVAIAEICAGEEANRLAAAAKAGPARNRQLGVAADHFRRAATVSTRLDAQIMALTLLADCYDDQHLNEPQRMEAALRDLIRLTPDDVTAVARLAQMQEQQGLFDAAEATLMDARRQRPEAIGPYRLLAQFYARRVTALSKDSIAQVSTPTSGPGEPDPDGVYRVGGSLTPPIRLDVPQYPPDASAAGIKGNVVAEVVIDPGGRVTDARVVQSIPLLDDAALAAVRNWQFAPTVVNGQPVPVRMNVTVNFSLAERSRPAGSPAPR